MTELECKHEMLSDETDEEGDRYCTSCGKWMNDIRAVNLRKERQLTMARFAMHKVRIKVYALEVLAGRMTEDQARASYNEAMRNFDQILELAVKEPARLDNCQADMDKGFVMPEVGK